MRRALGGLALLATSLLILACTGQPPRTQDIVFAIPWPDEESAQYLLTDLGAEDERGRGTLSSERRDGQFELRLSFVGEGGSDESTVLVDATTLKPDSVRREIRDAEGGSIIITGEYQPEEGIVEITERRDGDESTVPQRLEEHYYDNESSFFLWRTLPFQQGYEASYHSVLANQGRQILVTLKVVGKEEVTVPAGTFQAWRLEIKADPGNVTAWYADTPERPLVQFENPELDFLIQLAEPDREEPS